jgi:isoleucyl-tRNA synthetase
MDYKSTLNLPQTKFPMKANLSKREPEILRQWEHKNIYAAVTNAAQGRKQFILHDGPPYANGHIHMGTALNKILKDIIVKSKTMAGFRCDYVPGWDCHGLPIEHQVDKTLGEAKKQKSRLEVRHLCRDYARRFIDIQREEFKRLGVFGEWQNPYLTMDNRYVATIAREFGKFVSQGSLYRRKKPVQWCPSCRTALAEAEVEYEPHRSPSIYVKFPLVSDLSEVFPSLKGKRVSVVIWTTTPWTIPANLATVIHPDYTYVAVKVGSEVLVLAEGLLLTTLATVGIDNYEILERFPGTRLEKVTYRHPFLNRESPIILGTHVTLDAGTGCVHTAPGHGQEDYEIGLVYGLDIYAPVDDEGRFTDEAEHFAGQFVFDANQAVNEKLREAGSLLFEETIEHSYPHCWRCKNPIVFRATEQWFLSMEQNELRKKALEQILNVEWIPAWGRERIYGMVENRPDWCISRQRAWGVPLVLFACAQCHEPLASEELINFVADRFEKEGADVWFSLEAKDLLPEGTRCPKCNGQSFSKEMDILDVWFDSGVSHAAVLETRKNLKSPADMYLEGSDQHRGWFHSSLLTCTGTRNRAPYRSVLTHGFVVDAHGKKMSKTLGNVILPDEVIGKWGAEVLRLWVASEDYREDIRISQEILVQLSESYRKIRNTCRFLLGNLCDFDPNQDRVETSKMQEIDRWALARLNQLTKKVCRAYENYEFHTVYHSLHNFCITDLSAIYLDVLKDRLYCSPPSAPVRRSAQTALFDILKALTQLMAPVLSFTAEEIWQYIPGKLDTDSVHLTQFPQPQDAFDDSHMTERWQVLLTIRARALKAIEDLRKAGHMGNSLEGEVCLEAPPDLHRFLAPYGETLEDLFIVSSVVLSEDRALPSGPLEAMAEDSRITIRRAPGGKCERCWKYSTTVGETASSPTICQRCAEVSHQLGTA